MRMWGIPGGNLNYACPRVLAKGDETFGERPEKSYSIGILYCQINHEHEQKTKNRQKIQE